MHNRGGGRYGGGDGDERDVHRARDDAYRTQSGRGTGGVPDSLLVGVLVFLLGMTLLVWSATGLAGLFAHGSWPTGVTFTHTPLAMRHLIGAPHDVPGAWPATPQDQLSGYGLLWGLFIGQLMVLFVLGLFALGTLARWRAQRAARRHSDATTAPRTPHRDRAASHRDRAAAKAAPDADRPHETHRPLPAPPPASDGQPVPPPPAAQASTPAASAAPPTPSPATGTPTPGITTPGVPTPGTTTSAAPAAAPPEPPAGPTGPTTPPGAGRPWTPPVPPMSAAASATQGARSTRVASSDSAADGAPQPSPAPPQPPSHHTDTTTTASAHAPAASAVPPLVVLGPPDARHPAAVQAVRDAEGAALVITSDPGIWSQTKDARAKLGPVLLYDPTHRCDTPARLHWSPSAGCADRGVAAERATALLAPVRLTAKIDTAVADTAETLLRCFLHAAAVDGRQFRHVHRWAQGKQVQDAVRILRSHPKAASGAAGELEAALTAHPQRRDIAQELTARALTALSSVHIRDSCTPNRSDTASLDSFTVEGGTLYLVGEAIEDPKPHPGAMPLLTALASSVVEHGRRMAERSSSGRLDPPLTLILEDVAAVAPLPQLPALLSTGADRGLPTLALLRSREQARTRWPGSDFPTTLT